MGVWGGVPCTSCDSHLPVYTSASPSYAFFVVALQAQFLYDAVTHLQPCEMPRSMLSLNYCVLSHSARSHRAPLHLHRSTAPHPHTDSAASCRLPTHVIVMLRLPRSLRTHDTVLPQNTPVCTSSLACTPAPSEQPRCPSVVLWTPCTRVAVWSGVCSSRPSGFGEAARRASSLRT
jgi:hypothetical protein